MNNFVIFQIKFSAITISKIEIKIFFNLSSLNNQKDYFANLVLNEFDVFYNRYKKITESAKEALISEGDLHRVVLQPSQRAAISKDGVYQLLEQDKPVFCSGLVWNGNLDDMTFVGDADYDMVIVEMEHQGFDFNDLRTMLQFLMNRRKISENGFRHFMRFYLVNHKDHEWVHLFNFLEYTRQ